MKFACDEPSITNSEFCIFHDKDHYAEHEHEAAKRFEGKVLESISQNKPLKCIGYYLSFVSFANLLEEKNFLQPVYFNEATFYGATDFSEAKFSKEAHFEKATFSGEAWFSEATFSGTADFSEAKFSDTAIFFEAKFSGAGFVGTRFSKEADFSEVKFSKEVIFLKAKFSDIANFLKAEFSDTARFRGATFSGTADFSYAVFSGTADFFGATFTERAYFSEAKFSDTADFFGATFTERAYFSRAKFLAEVYFLGNKFTDKTIFKYIIFEQPNKVTFDDSDLSKVSFADSDITRIRFGDRIGWGGKDKFTITEEEWLKRKAREENEADDRGRLVEKEEVSLELVLSVYRNLRENYEFRLRYDDAGKFFMKEEELKRKYRETKSENGLEIKENGWFRRHFSLTGLYYHLSRYGESISRPALIGVLAVFLSTLFWVTQSNPTLEPHFDPSLETAGNSTFVGFREVGNPTQWLKGFERSLAGFIPLLSLGGDIKVGIIDYIIKIFGGGLTFVLLAIALRRKFERKYTR
jgi:uncharacterized protein YjbI with pentapeptide repeats